MFLGDSADAHPSLITTLPITTRGSGRLVDAKILTSQVYLETTEK
jgi:hypothetical protein